MRNKLSRIHTVIAGEMSDASEVLSAIYESLEGVAGGDALVHELFQWQVS